MTLKTDENNKDVDIEIPELEELSFENDDVNSKVKGIKYFCDIYCMFFIFLRIVLKNENMYLTTLSSIASRDLITKY